MLREYDLLGPLEGVSGLVIRLDKGVDLIANLAWRGETRAGQGFGGENREPYLHLMRGDKLLPAAEAVKIVRALPHGHVLAARRIALDALLPRRAPQRRRDLALALIVARLLEPAAKLATARMLSVVGRCTSIICTAANFSGTLRGVSPGASACRRRARVTCRQ